MSLCLHFQVPGDCMLATGKKSEWGGALHRKWQIVLVDLNGQRPEATCSKLSTLINDALQKHISFCKLRARTLAYIFVQWATTLQTLEILFYTIRAPQNSSVWTIKSGSLEWFFERLFPCQIDVTNITGSVGISSLIFSNNEYFFVEMNLAGAY